MSSEWVDKIIEALEPVAEKLGETAEFIYRLAIREVLVDGAINVLVVIGMILLIRFAVKGAKLAYNRFQEADFTRRYDTLYWSSDHYTYFWLGIGAAVVTVIASIVLLTNAVDAIHNFGNPEFRALVKIFDMVRNGEVR